MMFFEIAGSSVVSQVVQLDYMISCGQICSLEQQGVLLSVSGSLG